MPKTPVLKSQRTPQDFRQPKIKADRALVRDLSYVAECINVPIRVEAVIVQLDDEEANFLDALRLPVYGDSDDAALRDILFTWWEEQFLGTVEAGAPAIVDVP